MSNAPPTIAGTKSLSEIRKTSNEDEPKLCGTWLDHFFVRRVIGRGGMGTVYLADDSQLGRRVALKLIAGDRSVSGHEVERIIKEARVTAQLAHPNIVTIHSVGRHDGQPYLALEYVPGETLYALAEQQQLSAQDVLRTCAALAHALSHAHDRGVHHLDLKPSNVIVDADGRPRILDFGLAAAAEHATTRGVAGTPQYMAPEQWLAQPGAASDVWALGVMLYELLLGRHPFSQGHVRDLPLDELVARPFSTPHVPERVGELVGQCLEGKASMRPTPGDIHDVLQAALGQLARRGTSISNPYVGLDAFDERDAPRFFGREHDTNRALRRLRSTATLIVSGESGAGKSSFVRAGLLARFAEHRKLTTLVLRPGASPIARLASALAQAPGTDDSASELTVAIRQKPDLVGLRLEAIAASCQTNVALVVDQLEELFTMTEDEADRDAFFSALRTASAGSLAPVRLITTVRDDFLSRCATRLRGADVFVLGPMTPAELKRAIVEPARMAGVEWATPELVDRIVSETVGEASRLPLMQFGCFELWNMRGRDEQIITESAFEELGGVTGALLGHAERTIAGFDDDELRTAHQVLASLVNADGTRRPQRADAFPDSDRFVRVLGRLQAARLVVLRRELDDEGRVYELVHEALAAKWPRLARWVEQSRVAVTKSRDVETAARYWAEQGRRDAELWSGEAVRDAVRIIEDGDAALAPIAREFVDCCVEAERQVERRRRNLTTLAVAALAAVAAVATLVAVYTKNQNRRLSQANANVGHVYLQWRRADLVVGSPQLVPWTPSGWTLHDLAPNGRGPAGVRDVEALPTGAYAVRGGPAWLVVQREGCSSSELYITSLPGFSERGPSAKRLTVVVPSCSYSLTDTDLVPAGRALVGTLSEPQANAPEAGDEERQVVLPAFRMDRFEFRNRDFDVLVRNQHLTGIGPRKRPQTDLLSNVGDPNVPVTEVDAWTAEQACRFFGKRLPSRPEWVKAARGGMTFGAADNPSPRRAYPTGTGTVAANLAGSRDGYYGLAPVGSYPKGVGPYGTHDLIGNAQEWTMTERQALRVILGGNFSTRPDTGRGSTGHFNLRPETFRNFEVGFRCVSSDGG